MYVGYARRVALQPFPPPLPRLPLHSEATIHKALHDCYPDFINVFDDNLRYAGITITRLKFQDGKKESDAMFKARAEQIVEALNRGYNTNKT